MLFDIIETMSLEIHELSKTDCNKDHICEIRGAICMMMGIHLLQCLRDKENSLYYYTGSIHDFHSSNLAMRPKGSR